MENNNKANIKLFSIFEKVQLGKELSMKASKANTPKFDKKLPAKKARTPSKTKAKVLKLPRVKERIDKYITKQPVKPLNEQSPSSLHTTVKADENKKAEEGNTKGPNPLEKPSKEQLIKSPHSKEKNKNGEEVHESIDSLLEFIDIDAICEMVCSTKVDNETTILQNNKFNSASKLTLKKRDRRKKRSLVDLFGKKDNHLGQIKTETDIPKIKKNVSDYSGLLLLKKKVRKAKKITSQDVRDKRFTTCNTNLENIASTSGGLEAVAECNAKSPNDLEKINQKTQFIKRIAKNNEISTEKININLVVNDNKYATTDNLITLEKDETILGMNKDKHLPESKTKIANDNSEILTKNSSTNLCMNIELKEKQSTQERKRKRVRPRSDKSIYKAKVADTLDNKKFSKKSGKRPTICEKTLENDVLTSETMKNLDNKTKISNDNSETLTKNSSTNLDMNIELKEKQSTQELKRKRVSPQYDTSIYKAKVADTLDNEKFSKKSGKRTSICEKALENDVLTSETMKNLDNKTEISNDNSETLTKNSSTNLDMNIELKEKQSTQELKRKRVSPRSDKSIYKAKVADTLDNEKFSKKSGKRTSICEKTLENDVLTSETMKTFDKFDTMEKNKDIQANERSYSPQFVKNLETNVKEPRKQRIRKINIEKQPKNTYGKFSEDKLNSVEIRRIPKDILDLVLVMLEDEDHPIWEDRNVSCNAGIHHYWETRTMVSEQNEKMKYARQFLLRRDWLSLAKLLSLSKQDSKNNVYYPLLVKYAALCLAHTDKEQFNKFVKSVIGVNDDSAIIKTCTKIPRK